TRVVEHTPPPSEDLSPASVVSPDAMEEAARAYRRFRMSRKNPDFLTAVVDAAKVPDEAARAFAEIHESDPDAADRLAVAVTPFPEVGGEFLGFRIERELGRGAFGRVYLARQGDLAGRPVALKVAADFTGEPQTLAQLQHTNIVPIYSFHRA